MADGSSGSGSIMAKVRQPANVEIAALKKQVVQQGNLMQPGSGTPWEDRGSLGLVKAFFITCFKSVTSPGELWDQIRRPETTSDATTFATCCGVVAGVTWVVHSLGWDLVYSGRSLSDGVPPLLVKNDFRFTIDWQTWWVGAALQMVCAVGGMLAMLRLANFIYQKLLPHGIAARIPPALSCNVIAYALGPVILALLPFFGWALALLWLLILLIRAGIRRLHLGAGTGIISGILTFLVVTVLGFLIYVGGAFAWSRTLGPSVTFVPPPSKLDAP
jgi:hypothetical protein